MGNYFDTKAMARAKLFVTFHEAATTDNFVQGGDLIFIEEQNFFDDYTEMNTQTLHAFKKCLRLKQDLSDMREIKQWSRVGIVIDTDIDRVKYVLELGPEGFYKTEYMTRVLQLKTNQQTFAVRRQMVPLSWRQSKRLRKIADFLETLNAETGKYQDLYDLDEDQLVTNANWMNKTGAKKAKFMGDNDNEEPDSDDEDPMDYLDLVKGALFNTRRICEDIDENGSLYVQLWHIFNMFCGKLIDLDPENLSAADDDISSMQSYTTKKTGAQLAADETKTLEILSIPQFIRYFKVS